MKIPIAEALAKATPGPVLVYGSDRTTITFGRPVPNETKDVFVGNSPDAALLAHCRNNLPRLLAAIKAERAAFSKTRFEVHAVPEGSTDEWLAARKETNAAVKMAEEVEA